MLDAKFDVLHLPYTGVDLDAYGNEVDTWGPGQAKKFITFGQWNGSEPKVVGHERVVVDTTIITRPEFGRVLPKDRMVIDGIVYDVVGLPEDYTRNPKRHDFGCYEINLRYVGSGGEEFGS
ncbi:hypothetical protein [Gordonia paraffinivorans]|uniref:hypothetical protein n=1 Tax=Gordonia paraffinivorans TaxID=175628 RepID=UPI003FCD92E1